MKKFIYLIFCFLIASNISYSKKSIVVTGFNIKLIVQELTKDRIEVTNIIPPNVSLHTFTPKPSEVMKIKRADLLIYLSDKVDFWMKNFRTNNLLELMSLVPKDKILIFDNGEHNHNNLGHKNNIDPHFWLNPQIVKLIIPKLLDKIIAIDPVNAKFYRDNSFSFINKLEHLNNKIISKLSKYKGENVILFHPSFRYFLKQYNINYVGAIEEGPGKEPSPKKLIEIVKKIRKYNIKAIFIEPQLSDKAVKSIAREARIKVLTLDPVGNYKDRNSYEKMLMYNVNVFIKAFEK